MDTIDLFDGEFAFLSNYHVCQVNIQDLTCTSSESAYQAMKSLDLEKQKEIASSLPSRSKRLGRTVRLREDWEDVKDKIMYDIVFAKFSQHSDLKEKLLATKDAILIEGNTWGDVYWGKCSGIGKNKLGDILMRVRNELGKK